MKSEAKAERARRKLRALRKAKRRAQSVVEQDSMKLAPALANALATARAAYELCARTAKNALVAVAVRDAAASLERSFELQAPPFRATLRLGDRLRLEWLAAMPNAVESLLGECARVLAAAIGLSNDQVSERLRLASAEAHSLSHAVASEAGWRPSSTSVAFLSFAR